MLRRSTPSFFLISSSSSSILLAPAIPRHVWDPQRHDPKWVDSLAKPIADRRAWSAKKYSIGLEPLTPSEWLHYSKRNLAYEYNAAMRACETFPDVLPLYSEMKQRGVKLDVDTMYVVLGRAARYEKMEPVDAFLLFDEMVELGAKPDIAVVEILHTLWDLSAHCDVTWRELKRRELIRWYHRLAARDLAAFGQGGYDKLLLSQIRRYRSNLKQLGSVLHVQLWSAIFAHLRDPADLLPEFSQMLWERAPADSKFAEIPSLDNQTVTIPVLGETLSRKVSSASISNSNTRSGEQEEEEEEVNSDDNNEDGGVGATSLVQNNNGSRSLQQQQQNQQWSIENDFEANPLNPTRLDYLEDVLNMSSTSPTELNAAVWKRVQQINPEVARFEDFGLNRALLSALERIVDEPFPLPSDNPLRGRPTPDENFLTLALVGAAQRSGMFFSADVIAQALDTTRFNDDPRRRERNSIRYLGFALNVTNIVNRSAALNKSLQAWRQARCSLDDRVVARYIHCRDPWSDTVFCPSRGKVNSSFSLLLTTGNSAGGNIKENLQVTSGTEVDDIVAETNTENENEKANNNTNSNNNNNSEMMNTNNNNSNNNNTIASERWNNLIELLDRFSSWNKNMRAGKLHPNNTILTVDAADGVGELMTATSSFLLRMTEALAPSQQHQQQQQHQQGTSNSKNANRLFRSPEQQIKVLSEIFRMLSQVKRDVDVTCSKIMVKGATTTRTNQNENANDDVLFETLTPTIECWENLLAICRLSMDRLAHSRSTDMSMQKQADDLFQQFASLRSQLVHEAKERHDGKLKMLWLQEI